MWAGLYLLYFRLLQFAKRVLHEPHACFLRRSALPVLLHLLDESEYHLGSDLDVFCYGCHGSSVVAFAALSSGGSAGGSFPALGGFSVIRSVRALRPLRALKRVPGMPVLVSSILQALPKLAWLAPFLAERPGVKVAFC